MSNIAIRVENLSKIYRIGTRDEQPRGLAQAARSLVISPFAYLQRMRRPPTAEETLWALRDVSFEVKHGEVLGIIGRNGAGKSTLLKILSRITEPSSGQAQVFGRVGSLLEVGTGFHPELTGRENIYLNGAILGMHRSEIDRKFDEIVAFAEVERFLDTPVKRYSSGMYVRLAFAVAAHLEPEILLVDEVLAVGDVAFQQKCLGKMGDIAREGRTILFVSHNMAAIQGLTHCVIVLHNSTVQFSGTPEAAIQEYLTDTGKPTGASPLVQRTDRTGSAPGVIRDIRLFVNSQSVDNIAMTGLPLEIEIDYVADRAGRLDFFLAFYDLFDQRVAHLNSILTGLENTNPPVQGSAICSIPKFPLAPGRYKLAVAVDCSGETLDRVGNALQVEVSMADFYGTGQTRGSDWGLCLVEHQWRCKT